MENQDFNIYAFKNMHIRDLISNVQISNYIHGFSQTPVSIVGCFSSIN